MAETGTRRHSIRIGTRGSALALIQSEMVASALRAAHPGVEVKLVRISTRGDRVLDRPLSQIGGKALFVTEIEDAIRAGGVDIAVHSSKDLPSELDPDMLIGAFLERADARDALISEHRGLDGLPQGARVGTSSPRRQSQLRALRPDLELVEMRGNVDTRLRKLDGGQYDAMVLAMAGLTRLGVTDARIQPLPPDVMLPSAGQGAIAVEVLGTDTENITLVSALQHQATADAVLAERAFLAATGGGCTTAVAAHAQVTRSSLTITAFIGASDGRSVRGMRSGARTAGLAMARDLGASLLAEGGAALLQDDS